MTIQSWSENNISMVPKPVRLNVVYTTKCNINCIMCNRDRNGVTLDASCLDKIKELLPSVKSLSWQGGEVFCENEFDAILEFVAVKYPLIKQYVITNGLLINKKRAELLVNNNIDLAISIDSISKNTYEYIRKGASFNDLIDSLTIICDAEVKNYMPVTKNMNIVVMNSNYKQLLTYIDFASKYRFRYIHITPIYGINWEENIFYKENAEVLKDLIQIMNSFNILAKEKGIHVFDHVTYACNRIIGSTPKDTQSSIENISMPEKGFYCPHPWKEMFIDVSRNGNVYPDCFPNL